MSEDEDVVNGSRKWMIGSKKVCDVYSSDKVGGEMFLSDTFTFYPRFVEGHMITAPRGKIEFIMRILGGSSRPPASDRLLTAVD